jgi:hypothetical protein
MPPSDRSHAEILAALLEARERYGTVPSAYTWSRLGLRSWPEAIRKFYGARTFTEAAAIALAAYPQKAPRSARVPSTR